MAEFAPVIRRIKASAGSGKTYDLTRRFIEFLAASEAQPHHPLGFLSGRPGWGDILAVTFTNAAAAEMRERILRALKEAALGVTREGPLEPGRAGLWVELILRQYGALNVRTIDSLLQHVARSAAAPLGLNPDFEISYRWSDIFSPLADELMEQARERGGAVYNMVYDACYGMVHHERLAGFMAGDVMARRLSALLPLVLEGKAENRASADMIAARLKSLRRRTAGAARDMLEELRRHRLKARAGVEDALACAAEDDEEALKSAWLRKESLEKCLLKASLPLAPESAFAAYERLAEAAEAFCRDGAVLRRALALAPFLALAKALGVRMAEFQAREGLIPGFAVTGMALRALNADNGASQAALRIGSGLSHLFIDEFQDTSREQWRALRPLVMEALARGGSLTIVGDVKQAIYGWRGGDAELFDSVAAEAELLAMEPEVAAHVLPANWRSRAEIVKINNKIFSPLGDVETALAAMEALMPKTASPALLGESAALLSLAFRGAAQTLPGDGRADGGHVRIREISADSGSVLAEARLEAIIELLGELAARRPYGDIAVLVRGNREASELAARLMAVDIPVMTENSLVLDEHPLIRELLAFLTFLDSPDDNLAFWTALDGHIVAAADFLSRGELLELAAHKGKLPLFEVFRRRRPALWADLFEPLLNQSGLMVAYDLAREIYRRFDVMRRFAGDEAFLQRFLEIVHLAEGRGISTIPAFLDAWKDAGVEEKAPMPKVVDAVRVMTIHKSKGLEFPVVIIPSLAFTKQGDSSPRACEAAGLQVVAYGCKEMGDDYLREQAAALREAVHLCYVAFTRAVDELHVLHSATPWLRSRAGLIPAMDFLFARCGLELPLALGEPDKKARPEQAGAAGPRAAGHEDSDGGMAVDARMAPDGGAERACRNAGAEAGPLRAAPRVQGYELCPQGWRPMDWLPALKIFRNPLHERDEAAVRGEFVHACLAEAALHADMPAREAVERGASVLPYAVPEAMREGVADIIEWVRQLPGFAELLPDCMVERPLFDAQRSMFRLDMIAVENGLPRLIVDYKTGRPGEKDIEQVRNYIRLLSQSDFYRPGLKAALIYVDQRFCRIVDQDGVRDSARLF